MIKQVAALFAFGAFALSSQDAHAWFKICNKRSAGMYVAYSHYLASTNEVIYECSRIFGGGCPYSAWEVRGWWRLEPNQCATVLSGDIKNRFNYVHVDSDDGAVFSGNHSFRARSAEFRWHDKTTALPPVPGLQCLGQSSAHCTPNSYFPAFVEVNSGTAKNYTLNLNQ